MSPEKNQQEGACIGRSVSTALLGFSLCKGHRTEWNSPCPCGAYIFQGKNAFGEGWHPYPVTPNFNPVFYSICPECQPFPLYILWISNFLLCQWGWRWGWGWRGHGRHTRWKSCYVGWWKSPLFEHLSSLSPAGCVCLSLATGLWLLSEVSVVNVWHFLGLTVEYRSEYRCFS